MTTKADKEHDKHDSKPDHEPKAAKKSDEPVEDVREMHQRIESEAGGEKK